MASMAFLVSGLRRSCRFAAVGSTRGTHFTADNIAAANSAGEGIFRITSSGTKGFGVFAERSFGPEEVVLRATGLKKATKDSHTVQMGLHEHVQIDVPAVLVNHSCDANVGVIENDLGAYDFVSVKPIREGEEITIDYGAFEYNPEFFPKCICGAPDCRGEHIGFKHAPDVIQSKYGKYCASYLQSLAATGPADMEHLTHYTTATLDAANEAGKGAYRITNSESKGYGVFAEKGFAPGDVVLRANGLRKATKDSHTVQRGMDEHVQIDVPAVMVNHSCDANVGVSENDLGAYDFVCVKPIKAGEEITIDYGAFEFNPEFFPKCICGAPDCRGEHIGFKHAPDAIQKKYGQYCASYLKAWAAQARTE